MEQLYSPETLARLLGMAEQTIYNRHSTGADLPPSIKLGRLLRFRHGDVMAWLDKKQQAEKLESPKYASTKRRRGRPTKKEEIEGRRK
nr:helix-turn-helix domain-containing protein [uncultured Undibacterium sp.]